MHAIPLSGLMQFRFIMFISLSLCLPKASWKPEMPASKAPALHQAGLRSSLCSPSSPPLSPSAASNLGPLPRFSNF